MTPVQIIFVLEFLVQVINRVINFLLNRNQILLYFLEFLSLLFGLRLNFVEIFGCLIYEVFQVFFLLFNFFDQILRILDDKSCFFYLLTEELALKSLVFLFENCNLTCIFFDQLILRRKLVEHDLLLLEISFCAVQVQSEGVFVDDRFIH